MKQPLQITMTWKWRYCKIQLFILHTYICLDSCRSLNQLKQDKVFYAPTVWQSLVNRFYKVLVYFVSIIMNARALAEITSHKPKNFSVSSRHLYLLGIYGNLQLEEILFGGQRLENICSFHQLQTKYWKMSRESAHETNTL